MVKRVAVIGADKKFISVVKKNILGFYPELCWLEFNTGFALIT